MVVRVHDSTKSDIQSTFLALEARISMRACGATYMSIETSPPVTASWSRRVSEYVAARKTFDWDGFCSMHLRVLSIYSKIQQPCFSGHQNSLYVSKYVTYFELWTWFKVASKPNICDLLSLPFQSCQQCWCGYNLSSRTTGPGSNYWHGCYHDLRPCTATTSESHPPPSNEGFTKNIVIRNPE